MDHLCWFLLLWPGCYLSRLLKKF